MSDLDGAPLDIAELLRVPTWRAFDVDPSGRVLAGCDGGGTTQLVELGADGSQTQLTALPGACTGRYVPGARMAIVEHDQGGDERHQLSLLNLDPLPVNPAQLDELLPLVRDLRFFHNLVDVTADEVLYTTNRRNSVDFDVISLDLNRRTEKVVYAGGGAVEEVAVSPDSVRVVLACSTARPMSQQLVVVDSASAVGRPLTDPSEAAQHATLRWHPDGDSLFVTTDRGREHTIVARLEVGSAVWSDLIADADHDVTGWASPDGLRVLVRVNRDGEALLAIHDATTGRRLAAVDIPEGGWVGAPAVPDPIWSPDSRLLAVSFTSPTVPGDVWLVDATTGACARLVDSAAELHGHVPGEPRLVRIPADDHQQIPCLVYHGRGRAPETANGASVIHVHGGPESQAVRNFNPVVQGLAEAGFTVLVPNVRGSTGFGRRWYSADDVRLRPAAVRDLAALRNWIPTMGLDSSRVALWGGSYGGYMVLAGLAFQPDLWAAGVDIVGISSLVTFLENTSSYRRAQREREYGTLEQDREFLESISPLHKVDQIRAPLFVIHGANDPRVPLQEAEQLVTALRERGVPCQLLVYDDEGHGLAKRTNRLDAYPRAIAFLRAHLG
jgi:dipeptidyl aminopeptidase/acylaminoacyl peptidase